METQISPSTVEGGSLQATLTSAVALSPEQVEYLGGLLTRYRDAFYDFVGIDECPDPEALHLFIVPSRVLNDPENFPKLARADRTLYGVYRPMSRTLYVTPMVLREGYGFGLAHELAHHLYHVCGLSQVEPQEHLRVRSFEHHIIRREGIRWPSEYSVDTELDLPGVGRAPWTVVVQSEAKLSKARAQKSAETVQRALNRYLEVNQDRLWCGTPEPLKVRLVRWKGFDQRGKNAPRAGGHFFSDLSELYLPMNSRLPPRVLAREAAWIAHATCRSTFEPTAQSIDGFAATFAKGIPRKRRR
ncbi:MAG: hypothetical protein AAF658_01430 [Myxococcota bacterium]